MSLKNLIGQDRAVEKILRLLENGKIATSYLFCGEPGIGKKTAAVSLAKALNCLRPATSDRVPNLIDEKGAPATSAFSNLHPEINYDACDECDSCRKIDAGAHPDFLVVSPEENHIRVEEIRMIEDALSFKAFEGRKKVVVIDGAESMNLAAANAFLKTLEEPPADSVLILVSSRPDLLPATIASRCSRINFTPLSFDSCRNVLSGRISEKDLEIVTRLSMGRPGSAFSTDLVEERTWFLDLLKAMLQAERDGWASRQEIELWFDYLTVFLRDIAVLKITGDASKLINADLGKFLAGLSKSVDLKGIIKMQKELDSLKGLLIFNLNKSITWNYTSSLLRKELRVRDA